jgi:hypothetical protein
MRVDVEFCGNAGQVVDDEWQGDDRPPASRGRSGGKPAREGHAGGRSAWRWVPVAADVAVACVGLFFHHPLVLTLAVVTGAVAVLFSLVSLGLFAWTLIRGGEVPSERAFRVMRFIAAREEPRAPALALVPAQASSTGIHPGTQVRAAEPDRRPARTRPGASRRPAGSRPRAFTATGGSTRPATRRRARAVRTRR